MQVNPTVDQVAVDGRVVRPSPSRTYLMMNKPAGVLTSVGDPHGRPTVIDGFESEQRLYPVGRLDLQSRGLLLLTDDGELAMRLMHPRYAVEKEYLVTINGTPDENALRRLREGLLVQDEQFGPAEVRLLDQGRSGATRLRMVLREGRKREIRRMWQAFGHRVIDLQRLRIDGLELGDLPEGSVRSLSEEEVARLRAAVS